MIKERTKTKPFGTPQPCYFEPATGKEYRRIYGGMAWPETQPGFAVVIGEEFEADETLEEHKCWIITEYESHIPSDLIRRCREFQGLCKVDNIYGDTSNLPMMEFVRGNNFHLLSAPFADAPTKVQYYRLLIREMTTAPRKILQFGQNNRLPEILTTLDQDSFSESPAAMALGYALSALRTYSYCNPNEFRREIMPEYEESY